MKKFLLASTALVGAISLVDQAAAQQLTTDSPFTVRIDGFANFRGVVVSESNRTSVSAGFGNPVRNSSAQTAGRSDSFRSDTEIHFTATGKADNGLIYGMYVELEGDPLGTQLNTAGAINTPGGTGVGTTATITGPNFIDEANIFLQGSWGRIELGDQDGAGDQLFFGAPYDYGPSYGNGAGADGDVLFRLTNPVGYTPPSGALNGAFMYGFNVRAYDSSDASKITYLTPVISGFRAGVSFVPDSASNGFSGGFQGAARQNITITSLTVAGIAAGNAAGTLPAIPAQGATGFANNYGNNGDFQHWIELGLQWRGTIGDVGLGANFSYSHAEHKKAVFSPTAGQTSGSLGLGAAGTSGYNFNDINSWAIGLQGSWMGVTVGGSYANH